MIFGQKFESYQPGVPEKKKRVKRQETLSFPDFLRQMSEICNRHQEFSGAYSDPDFRKLLALDEEDPVLFPDKIKRNELFSVMKIVILRILTIVDHFDCNVVAENEKVYSILFGDLSKQDLRRFLSLIHKLMIADLTPEQYVIICQLPLTQNIIGTIAWLDSQD